MVVNVNKLQNSVPATNNGVTFTNKPVSAAPASAVQSAAPTSTQANANYSVAPTSETSSANSDVNRSQENVKTVPTSQSTPEKNYVIPQESTPNPNNNSNTSDQPVGMIRENKNLTLNRDTNDTVTLNANGKRVVTVRSVDTVKQDNQGNTTVYSYNNGQVHQFDKDLNMTSGPSAQTIKQNDSKSAIYLSDGQKYQADSYPEEYIKLSKTTQGLELEKVPTRSTYTFTQDGKENCEFPGRSTTQKVSNYQVNNDNSVTVTLEDGSTQVLSNNWVKAVPMTNVDSVASKDDDSKDQNQNGNELASESVDDKDSAYNNLPDETYNQTISFHDDVTGESKTITTSIKGKKGDKFIVYNTDLRLPSGYYLDCNNLVKDNPTSIDQTNEKFSYNVVNPYNVEKEDFNSQISSLNGKDFPVYKNFGGNSIVNPAVGIIAPGVSGFAKLNIHFIDKNGKEVATQLIDPNSCEVENDWAKYAYKVTAPKGYKFVDPRENYIAYTAQGGTKQNNFEWDFNYPVELATNSTTNNHSGSTSSANQPAKGTSDSNIPSNVQNKILEEGDGYQVVQNGNNVVIKYNGSPIKTYENVHNVTTNVSPSAGFGDYPVQFNDSNDDIRYCIGKPEKDGNDNCLNTDTFFTEKGVVDSTNKNNETVPSYKDDPTIYVGDGTPYDPLKVVTKYVSSVGSNTVKNGVSVGQEVPGGQANYKNGQSAPSLLNSPARSTFMPDLKDLKANPDGTLTGVNTKTGKTEVILTNNWLAQAKSNNNPSGSNSASNNKPDSTSSSSANKPTSGDNTNSPTGSNGNSSMAGGNSTTPGQTANGSSTNNHDNYSWSIVYQDANGKQIDVKTIKGSLGVDDETAKQYCPKGYHIIKVLSSTKPLIPGTGSFNEPSSDLNNPISGETIYLVESNSNTVGNNSSGNKDTHQATSATPGANGSDKMSGGNAQSSSQTANGSTSANKDTHQATSATPGVNESDKMNGGNALSSGQTVNGNTSVNKDTNTSEIVSGNSSINSSTGKMQSNEGASNKNTSDNLSKDSNHLLGQDDANMPSQWQHQNQKVNVQNNGKSQVETIAPISTITIKRSYLNSMNTNNRDNEESITTSNVHNTVPSNTFVNSPIETSNQNSIGQIVEQTNAPASATTSGIGANAGTEPGQGVTHEMPATGYRKDTSALLGIAELLLSVALLRKSSEEKYSNTLKYKE